MPATLMDDLSADFALSPQQIAQFKQDGFIKLKNVLSAQTLEHYGKVISDLVIRLNTNTQPMEQRNTYQKAFLQISNLWQHDQTAREFVFSRKLASIAAKLMGVKGVRLYHDQALYKESGGGLTPWHADQYYWPLATDRTVTVWIPLQATPREMGPLALSVGSQRFNMHRDLEISDDSERKISKTLLEHGLPIEDGPFDLGEVSYHLGWTFHRAGPNTSERPRKVMTVIYFADGTTLAKPANKNQENDWNNWLPGAKIGEVINTPLSPVLYRE